MLQQPVPESFGPERRGGPGRRIASTSSSRWGAAAQAHLHRHAESDPVARAAWRAGGRRAHRLRRLAQPLLILAEGTQAVAQGRLQPAGALPASDELGVLTLSFQPHDAPAPGSARRRRPQSRRGRGGARLPESVSQPARPACSRFSAEGHLRAANHTARCRSWRTTLLASRTSRSRPGRARPKLGHLHEGFAVQRGRLAEADGAGGQDRPRAPC